MAPNRSDRFRLSLLRSQHRLDSEDSASSKKKRRWNPRAANSRGVCGGGGGGDGDGDNDDVHSVHDPPGSNDQVEARSQSVRCREHGNGNRLEDFGDHVCFMEVPGQINNVSEARTPSIHVEELESYKCLKVSSSLKDLKEDDDHDNDNGDFLKGPCPSNDVCEARPQIIYIKERESHKNFSYGYRCQHGDVSCTNKFAERNRQGMGFTEVKEIYECTHVKKHEICSHMQEHGVHLMNNPCPGNNVVCLGNESSGTVPPLDVKEHKSSICSDNDAVRPTCNKDCNIYIKDDMSLMDIPSQGDNAANVKINNDEVQFDVSHCAHEVNTNLRDDGIFCKGQTRINIVQEGFSLLSRNVHGDNATGTISVLHGAHSTDPVMLSEDEEQIYEAIFSNDSGDDSCSQLVFPGQWDPWDIGGNSCGPESILSLDFLPTPSINECSDTVCKISEEPLGDNLFADVGVSPVDPSADLYRLCELLGLNKDALSCNHEFRSHNPLKHDIDRVVENGFAESASHLDLWIRQLFKEEMNPFCCALLLIAKSSSCRERNLTLNGALKFPSMVHEWLCQKQASERI